MSDNEFELKYLKNGQEVVVVRSLDIGSLVSYVMMDHDTGSTYINERVHFVSKVFSEPPTAKISDRLTDLKAEVSELTKTRDELKAEIELVKKTEADRFKRYKQFEQLKQLDRFLDGKITHFAICDYRKVHILSMADIKGGEYDRGNIRLLSLFGKSNGDLTWRLNTYSDGSGGYTEVTPCCDYEEALLVCQGYINDLTYIDKSTVETAEKYGLSIPPQLLRDYHDKRLSSLAKSVQERKNALANAETELANAENEKDPE